MDTVKRKRRSDDAGARPTSTRHRPTAIAQQCMCVLPSAPRALGLARRHAPFLAHIEDLAASLREARAGREASGKAARAAQDLATLAIHRRQIGDADGAATALSAAADDLGASLHGRVDGSDEEPTFSTAAQQLIAAETFDAFLRTGTLGARPSSTYTDEEWLGGLIAATHEVGRYAGLAATAGDVRSVEGAAAVVGALHEGLMNFDFRNGSLRRGFDSVKYVERRLEDTLYELKLFPPPPPAAGDASAAEAAYAGTAVAPLALVDGAGLDAARAAYATLDAAREEVIKKCREPQKQAKQAIYALQRGDGAAGGRQIEAARKLARLLLAEVKPHPTLRQQAALKGMLEELAEACPVRGPCQSVTASLTRLRHVASGGPLPALARHPGWRRAAARRRGAGQRRAVRPLPRPRRALGVSRRRFSATSSRPPSISEACATSSARSGGSPCDVRPTATPPPCKTLSPPPWRCRPPSCRSATRRRARCKRRRSRCAPLCGRWRRCCMSSPSSSDPAECVPSLSVRSRRRRRSRMSRAACAQPSQRCSSIRCALYNGVRVSVRFSHNFYLCPGVVRVLSSL